MTLRQEQKEGLVKRSELRMLDLQEYLSMRGVLEVKENTSLIILSQYRSSFIHYKYTSLVSNKSKMRHREQY